MASSALGIDHLALDNTLASFARRTVKAARIVEKA
jgi:hypothetical protein